jgi:two-component system sensor histidine kinase QseC
MLSDEPAMREQAISQIVLGVDRTSRLVRQLLDMATVEGFEQEIGAPSADAYHLLCLLYDDLRGLRGNAVSFKIDESIEGLTLLMSPDLFALAARNLLENALLHSPEGSVVHCWAEQSEGMAEVFIKDQGRGVDTRELPRITERFYRGRDKRAVGSGLGLSIAEAALAASASTLHLGNALGGGFLASMRMPARRGQTTPRSSHRERLRKHSGDAPEDGLQAAGPHGAHVQAGRIAPATD